MCVCALASVSKYKSIQTHTHTIVYHVFLAHNDSRVVFNKVVEKRTELQQAGRGNDDCRAVVASDFSNAQIATAHVFPQIEKDLLLFNLQRRPPQIEVLL